jgi:predicted ribosome quality control (RQC) complex YloA/Tae2 family protein
MRVTGFDATLKPAEVLENDSLIEKLMLALEEAKRVVQEITSSEASKGYIISKPRGGSKSPNTDAESDGKAPLNLVYDDFHPFRPMQFVEDPTCYITEIDGFNDTVDEFFSSIEVRQLESRLHERELTAKKKLEAAREDQAKRLGGLQEVQELNVRKANAIEANRERVQEAMDAVNSLITSGKDWVEIEKLVEFEQKRQNPVAEIIKLPLHLEQNAITLLLGEEEFLEDNEEAYATDSDVSDSEDEASKQSTAKKTADKQLAIDINLGMSPWSNAREYYDHKRSAAAKEVKTAQAFSKAMKSQEQKITQELKKSLKQEKPALRPVRQQLWFERFIWFISSDGYLVLAGRDAQQNEMLYKKYLRKGDVSHIRHIGLGNANFASRYMSTRIFMVQQRLLLGTF